MNSFSGVERALEAEFTRQCGLLDAGQAVEQQTMLWDAETGVVRPARTKEGSHDYRYFPDPDLPPLILPLEMIDRIRRAMPELPDARRDRFRSAYPALSDYDIDVLTSGPALAAYFDDVARRHGDAKAAANWILGEVLALLKSSNQVIDHFTVRPADLAELLDLVRDGVVSRTAAKQVFAVMVKTGDRPRAIAEREGVLIVRDDNTLRHWIDVVLSEHPEEAARFLGGEKRLQGVLVGYVLKQSKGSADPKRVNQLLSERLGT